MIEIQKQITLDAFKRLSEVHGMHCVSMFMPTSKNARSDIDKIRFKNQMKNVADKLMEYGLSKTQINDLLASAREQLDEDRFWKFLMHGLALFIYDDKTEGYLVSESLDEYTYVNDHLYLMPLIPAVQENNPCYVLLLSADSVRFFERSGDTLNESNVFEEALPKQLEDVVGYDYKQKSLQVRGGQESGGHGMYHGQGAGSQEERKDELRQMFRRINDVITRNAKDRTIPLLVGCVDYLYPLYREVNTYPALIAKPMTGNFSETPVHEVSRQVTEHLARFPDDEKARRKSAFHELVSKKLASYQPEEVVPAGVNGRIDTLFVNRSGSLWGKFDPATNKIVRGDKRAPGNVCLLNLTALRAYFSNARIFLLKGEEMPEENTVVNAIFRY